MRTYVDNAQQIYLGIRYVCVCVSMCVHIYACINVCKFWALDNTTKLFARDLFKDLSQKYFFTQFGTGLQIEGLSDVSAFNSDK